MANTLNLGNGNWATKEDSLLAYNNENNNFKPLPFDFTRASSATVVNKAGLIETVGGGEPRIDFSNDAKGALLLEPSRTNLVTSSNFKSGWSLLSGGSITQNQSISPDGTQNAAILSGDGANANAAFTSITVSIQEYTYSMFAKKGSEYILKMIGFSAGANGGVEFNLNDGTIETSSAGTFSNEKIEDYGNGWYRCSVKVTVTSSGSKLFGFNREAIVSGDLFSVYGAQLEQGSYATSYIPTQGSAVTRSADVCDNGGNEQVINSTEGVLYFEGSVDKKVMSSLGLSDGSGVYNNTVAILFNLDSINQITSIYRSNNITTFSTVPLPLNFNKIAIRYFSNTLELWLNGVMVGSETFTTQIASNVLNSFKFEKSNNTLPFYGKTREVKLYNTALTDAELAALTTI